MATERSFKIIEDPDNGWEGGGRAKDREALRKAKAAQIGKEYIKIPILNGYKLVEKNKYERMGG